MPVRVPDFYPERINLRVPGMAYVGEHHASGPIRLQLGAPVALNATGILNAQSIAAAGASVTFDPAYTPAAMGPYGRNVSVALSGAGTPTIDVRGRDYLGQRMRETLTGAGAAAVLGLKAFKYIDSVTWGLVAGTTLNVGWGNAFGFQFKARAMTTELKNGVISANAGTFVPGLAQGTAPTAINADVRGTYLPVTVLPNGTNIFEVFYLPEDTYNNMHGSAQFYS